MVYLFLGILLFTFELEARTCSKGLLKILDAVRFKFQNRSQRKRIQLSRKKAKIIIHYMCGKYNHQKYIPNVEVIVLFQELLHYFHKK